MMRKKVLLLLVGVATTTLMGVGIHVRADKKSIPETKANSRSENKGSTAKKNKSVKPKTTAKIDTTKNEPKTLQSVSPEGNSVLWQENFANYTAGVLNPAYWNVASENQPIYNEELQKYSNSPSTVRVEAGNLVLEARGGANGITSGMVNTKGKIKVSQGSRVEARIKLPKGRGTWPAFWLLSDNQPYTTALNPTDADWNTERFYMHDGELDIMESYGSYPGVVEATVHTFAQTYEQQLSLGDEGFHNYWLEWSAGKIVMGVDNKTISTYAADASPLKWPYTTKNQMYIILNLAMGGTGGGPIVSSPTDSWRMDVSSITVSKL